MPGEALYTDLAEYYDLIDGKSREALRRDVKDLSQLIGRYQTAQSDTLLDAGCGTGGHLQFLENVYDCVGVDVHEGVLEVAREKTSEATFEQADMTELQLDASFGAVICLYDAIGYTRTRERLRRTLEGFHDHLEEGGVAVVEPFFEPAEYKLQEGEPSMTTYDGDDLKIARLHVIKSEGRTSILNLHYLLAEEGAGDVRYVADHHELGLFEIDELLEAVEDAGFETVAYLEDQLTCGAIVGVR